MLRLQQATVATILRLAGEYPTIEVCGFVWASGDWPGDGELQHVVPLRNTHPEPSRYYSVDAIEMTEAYRVMERAAGEPLAFYHSHPGGKPDPSEQDMLGALNTGMHYLIAYPWVPEFAKDQAAFHGAEGPIWRLSAWECIGMQILVEDQYEVIP